jgi:hypothetical protein
MNQLEKLCQLVLDQLSKEGYTNWGITRHTRTYDTLCKYAFSKGIDTYSDELVQAFITEKYQADMNAKRGQNTQFITQRITHLLKLRHFQKTGNIHYCSKGGQKQKQKCPDCFNYIWSTYIETLGTNDYAKSTIMRARFQSMKFLQYLSDNEVDDLNDVSYEIVSRYLLLHMKQSKNYLKAVITIEDTPELHYKEINPEKDCVELMVSDGFSYTTAIKTSLRQNHEQCERGRGELVTCSKEL